MQIVGGIIVAFGGASAIVGAAVKWSANIIADRLSSKYEIKLNKELESYKAHLDKKIYVSRARFDAEFQIYKDISEKILSMVECTYWLFPKGLDRIPLDEEERKKIYLDRYKDAVDAASLAQKAIRANAPFIPERFYTEFEELSVLCVTQCNMYTWFGALGQINRNTAHETDRRIENEEKCCTRTEEILQKRESVMKSLREYLQKLEVTEEK